MSEKELSKNGNTPHVPKEQINEAELLPLGNDDVDAEGHEAEIHPDEAVTPPPENDAGAEGHEAESPPHENSAEAESSLPKADDAEGHEVEIHQTEAKSPPKTDNTEAEGHEAETRTDESSPPTTDEVEAEVHEAKPNPVEAKRLPPTNDGARRAERHKADYHQIDAILARLGNDAGKAGHEADRNPVEAESSPRKKYGAGRAQRQKAQFHPADEILSRRRNDDAGEAEGHEVERDSTEVKDSNQNVSLEGAVGGVIDDCNCNDIHIFPGKEDLFRKFFSDEYDQAKEQMLSRQRHLAEIERTRHRHASADSKLSDPNPLGCLQDVGTSGGAVLNQAGAIIGKYTPKEEMPEYARFGTEFGQSLPFVPTNEGSERSIGSISTAPIGEIYGGTFSVTSDLSNDSVEFAQRISFASFSSRPPTDTSDNLEASLPPNSNSPEDEQLSVSSDSKNVAQERPVRRRTSGIVIKPEQIRSKSALARLSAYEGESQDGEMRQRTLSKDRSVRSEPLPQRKISDDSSVDSSEQMSLDDEANYTDSLESDSYMPVSDIDTVDSLEENLGSLRISVIGITAVVQNVALEQNEVRESAEQDPETTSSSPEAESSLEQDSEASERAEPVTKGCCPGTSRKPRCE